MLRLLLAGLAGLAGLAFAVLALLCLPSLAVNPRLLVLLRVRRNQLRVTRLLLLDLGL